VAEMLTEKEFQFDNQTIAIRQVVNHMVSPSTEELYEFCSCFSMRSLSKGNYFVKAGESGENIAFVNNGLMRFFYQTPDGKEFNKSFCCENQFIGAYSAYLSKTFARFSIQVLEDSQLLVAKLTTVTALAEKYNCWENFRRIITEELYVRKEQREAELLLDDAETRYKRFQKRYPGLEQRIAQYHVASYLGITPVALSRIRSQNKIESK